MLYRNNFRWPGVSQFLRDEHGSATIEFVLWVPIFVVILVAATDATVLYLHHTEMFLYSRAYTVATSNPTDLDVQIMIQTQISDASVFGFFEPVMGRYLTAMVTMRREPI